MSLSVNTTHGCILICLVEVFIMKKKYAKRLCRCVGCPSTELNLEPGVKLHTFPKPWNNEEACKRWISSTGDVLLRLEHIGYSSYMCSKHFVGGKGPTEQHPDPVPFNNPRKGFPASPDCPNQPVPVSASKRAASVIVKRARLLPPKRTRFSAACEPSSMEVDDPNDLDQMTGRRVPATCAAVNCSNRAKKGSGITFFPFPHSNEELMKKWLIAMRRAKFTPTKAHYLCSTHFEDKCFSTASNGRRILHSRAIPSKFNFPAKRPIRIPAANTSTINRSGSTDGPPIYTALPIVISPPQQQVNPVRRAFLKDHCYSLPGLQKLKKSLDESEGNSSITRSQTLALSDAEEILGTALQERRIILNGVQSMVAGDDTSVSEVQVNETPPSNPIQEHIDACVMKAVTPLEQQIIHMQKVVSALTTQLAHQKDPPTISQSRGRGRPQTSIVSESRRELFDWASLKPAQPSGCSLPTDEHEIQVLATRLAVSFSDIPAEAIAEQFQVHYILTQFAAWPSLPPTQRLATYRMAKMLYVAITKGWPAAIQMEQESQGLVLQSATENIVRVPVQVNSYGSGKRSSSRGGLVSRGRRGR